MIEYDIDIDVVDGCIWIFIVYLDDIGIYFLVVFVMDVFGKCEEFYDMVC